MAPWRHGRWAMVLALISVGAHGQPLTGGTGPRGITAVAALSLDVALAVAGTTLWRTDHGAWVRIPVRGAIPLDVTSARGALWVLAVGTEAQSGVALVLRTEGGGELTLAGTVPLPHGDAPRSLGVARAQEWIVAGTGPLLRVRSGTTLAVELPGPETVRARWMPDEVLALRRADGTLTTWRWGEARSVTRAGAVGLVAGQRTTLVLRADGALEPGPPWAPMPPGARPWLPPSGIVPMDAVVLADGRAVEVARDGRGEVSGPGGWRALERAPGAPEALLATPGGAVLALEDGRLCALEGLRWVARVGALPAMQPAAH